MRFEIVTTSQVERTYHVEADDADQAMKRLRTYLHDPEAVREGLVTKLAQERNVTAEKRTGEIKTTPEKPKAVADVSAAS
jgi:hypothetical protein